MSPIYDYLCTKCGTKEEVIRSMDDEEPQLCEKCKEVMVRCVSSTTFKLKGHGWPGKDIKESK